MGLGEQIIPSSNTLLYICSSHGCSLSQSKPTQNAYLSSLIYCLSFRVKTNKLSLSITGLPWHQNCNTSSGRHTQTDFNPPRSDPVVDVNVEESKTHVNREEDVPWTPATWLAGFVVAVLKLSISGIVMWAFITTEELDVHSNEWPTVIQMGSVFGAIRDLKGNWDIHTGLENVTGDLSAAGSQNCEGFSWYLKRYQVFISGQLNFVQEVDSWFTPLKRMWLKWGKWIWLWKCPFLFSGTKGAKVTGQM